MCSDHRHEEPNLSEISSTTDGANGSIIKIRICWRREGSPYFQCLKRNSHFAWTDECEAAFLKLKEYLATPPVLCKPQVGIPLRLDFAVTEWAISSVLVQEQNQVQKPIYFVSKALQGPELRYQSLEKATLAVIFSARRLRHYFHSFTVVVMTN